MAFYDVSVASDKGGRRLYTYEYDQLLNPGDIVVAPFASKQFLGIIRAIVKKPTFKTKKIVQKTGLTLPQKSIDTLQWLEQFYPYDFSDLSRLFIPPNSLINSRTPAQAELPITQEKLPTKNKGQQTAYNILTKADNAMLHGITGSGKTRVFTELAKETLERGKSVLIITPEIGLTPQMLASIGKNCPYPIYSIHSKKTPAQRKAIWEMVSTNKNAFVIVGPRSSLFLPYLNLGLVVADESHDQSYKNMSSPRYNGVYVASKLANIHGAKFVQSTATPNVSDLVIYKDKGLPVIPLNSIAAGEHKTEGEVIDLNDKDNFTKNPNISDKLIEAINSSLKTGSQALIFLNRRGSARVVQCKSCSYTEECPHCGLPLTFHHDSFKLICHICGYQTKASQVCTSCGSTDLLFHTPGTKGLEQDFHSLFPNANIARFDLDNSVKDNLRNRYQEILDGKIDIILGTQLISKGLDLPSLSVVGVLNADSTLQMPDFRAEEVAFQQLYQVTGRVGRGHQQGSYLIQTRNPDNPIIQAALRRDYDSFFKYESNKRKIFGYPPYVNIALLKIIKTKDETAKKSATEIANKIIKSNIKVNVLGPSPSYYHRSVGGYCWQIILKSKSRKHLLQAIEGIPSDWTIDMDPVSLL